MSQQHICRGRATSIFTENRTTHVVYHNTIVVQWTNEMIQLDSGGWQTITTKTRMNQASNQFGLGFSVYQRAYKWYVDFKGVTHTFQDGMCLKREAI
jgi:hypothetical protein